MSLQTDARKQRDSSWWETGKIIIQALLLAMVVRGFFDQPFNMPAGSMKSTFMVGEYRFVAKLTHGDNI